jgi:allophanate hydrolase
LAARLHPGEQKIGLVEHRMPLSFDFTTLRRVYRDGRATLASIAREVADRIAARGDDGVWISPMPADVLQAAAEKLEARAQREGIEGMPLYGLPFAVKDNIDAAGLPTTCACPGFAHMPARSAPAVQRLLEAGALLVGKTNLDQFATGLVGVRSPYGVARNPFDAAFIPGGSSSGSAVAVATGLVAFALGTDTAGSGRVPAGFNNIVGLKPTRGLISATGVVPACRSLDCVSVFALTVPDAAAALDVARGFDPADGLSRTAPTGFTTFGAMPAAFAFGVPRPNQREFFGNADGSDLFTAAIARLEALGGRAVEIDFGPFAETGNFVYRGPWVAERLRAVRDAIGDRRDLLHPVTQQIVGGAEGISAVDAFAAWHRLAALRQQTEAVWRTVDLLLVPTTGTIYRIAEIEADPIGPNATLGHYTNFVNLLDLAALAVPAGFRRDGLPFGVTLVAPAFHDPLLAAIGSALHQAAALPLGATGYPLPEPRAPDRLPSFPYVPLAVVGAHLSGEPLNPALAALGARLRRATRTVPDYRLYALADGKRPGLVRRPGDGVAIEVEIWDLPAREVGAFLAGIAPPLGLGTVVIEDGSAVVGFLCEGYAIEGARDISEFGGWRAWRAAGEVIRPAR